MMVTSGCENSFKLTTPAGSATPTNPGATLPTNSSRVFYYAYGTFGQIDATTRQPITIFEDSTGSIQHVTTPRASATVTRNYFLDYSKNILYLFNLNTLSFDVMDPHFTGIARASGNSLLVFNSSYEYFVYRESDSVRISANQYYGLDGTVDSLTGSNCTELGREYFMCSNSGTNAHKILLLKKDSHGNPSYKTFSVLDNLPSISPWYQTTNSSIIVLADTHSISRDYYHFNFLNDTFTKLDFSFSDVQTYVFSKNEKFMFISRLHDGSRIKYQLLDGNTGSMTTLVNSTITSGNSGNFMDYYWNDYYPSADGTKHTLVGWHTSGYTVAVAELSQSSQTIYGSDLDSNYQVGFINGKYYYLFNNEYLPLEFTYGSINLSSDLTLNNRIKSAYCLKNNYPISCQINIQYMSPQNMISGLKFISTGIEVEGNMEYSTFGLNSNNQVVFPDLSQNYYYQFEEYNQNSIPQFNNQNRAM